MPTKVLIASVLKPVDDVRSFERFALSIHANFEVFLVGAPSLAPLPKISNIHFLPYAFFPRRLVQRWRAALVFQRYLWNVKPQIVIVQSPDLLPFAAIYALLHNCQLIYDVQENYRFNIFHQGYYQGLVKYILANAVRMVEIISSCCISRYWIAERSYADELFFVKNKCDFVPNKYAPLHPTNQLPKNIPPIRLTPHRLRLIYTGTVSCAYGTHLAIDLAKKLHAAQAGISLLVIGSCSDEKYRQELEKMVTDCPFIDWRVSPQPLNHQLIIKALANADLALMPYLPNRSTERCMPTKLYEYMAFRLPFLMPANPLWESVALPWRAGLVVNFQNIDTEKLLQQIVTTTFYDPPPPQWVWRFNRKQFRRLLLECPSRLRQSKPLVNVAHLLLECVHNNSLSV
ncbi:MAG: glycosyltransferase [Cytophagales bacterium]|nr:glycosyltransferase [Bernardetiaceae bacterium]MDW8204068.1 glycosyltransferase [Cytophagales bacterium]